MTITHNRKFSGIWIPAEIWLENNLNVLEKILLVEIDSLDNEKGCIAGNDYFAGFLGVTTIRVSQMIKKLKEENYIYEESFDGRIRTLKSNIKTILKQSKENYKAPLKEILKQDEENYKAPLKEILNNNNTINNQVNNQVNNLKKINKKEPDYIVELSDGLKFILEAKMNKKIVARDWQNEIRKLVEIDLSIRQDAINDVKKVIQAIADNYGKDYFPVVESAKSLRSKFTKIEEYIKRSNSPQKLTKDQQQDLINKRLEEMYANNENF